VPRIRDYESCDCDDETPNHKLCSHCHHNRRMDAMEKAEADANNEQFKEGLSK
jgi:hypothetical protein